MNYILDLTRYVGIKTEKLPKKWYPFYVVYAYSWSDSTYILGFDTDVLADEMQNMFLKNKEISRCEIFGHFPRELLT